VYENNISINTGFDLVTVQNGLSGDDNDIVLVELVAGSESAVYSNSIEIYTGEYIDQISVSLLASNDSDTNVYSNTIEIGAGEGEDLITINISTDIDDTLGGDNDVALLYGELEDLGDFVFGLDKAVQNNIDLVLIFNEEIFNGDDGSGDLDPDSFTYGTEAGDANDYFIYDAPNNILFYDADGSGTAFTQQRVVTFDDPIFLSASNIEFAMFG
jgi:hypothetical protein